MLPARSPTMPSAASRSAVPVAAVRRGEMIRPWRFSYILCYNSLVNIFTIESCGDCGNAEPKKSHSGIRI